MSPLPPPMLPSYPEPVRRRLAQNVLERSLRLARGENVLIETWSATLDWAESFALEARRLGARPLLILEDEETFWRSVREARAADVGRVGGHEWAALKAADAHVFLYGPLDTAREEALPISVKRRIEADDHEWFRLVEKRGIRCVRFDLGRTSELSAERFGVDVAAWRKELIDAASVDPRELQKEGLRVARILRHGHEATITHPNGTELTLRLAGRTPRVDDGVIDDADLRAGNVVTVVPSGVTSVTVDERVAEGTFVANVMGVMYDSGRQAAIAGGNWTFRNGRLSEYSFTQGGEEYRRAFTKLGPGKDRPGLLSVGLNPRTTSIPLLFDQERGVITLAVGRNSYLGGKTKMPHLTAYQAVRGATLRVDGETVVEAGHIL